MAVPSTAPTAAPTGPPTAAPIAVPTMAPPTGSCALACVDHPSARALTARNRVLRCIVFSLRLRRINLAGRREKGKLCYKSDLGTGLATRRVAGYAETGFPREV